MEENSPPPISAPPPAAAPPPPPPSFAPPPVMSPLSPKPPRRGRGWMVFAFIVLALLMVSVLFNLSHFASGLPLGKSKYTRTGGPKLEEVITEDNDAANKIAVIEIEGIILSRPIDQSGYNMVDLIKAEL